MSINSLLHTSESAAPVAGLDMGALDLVNKPLDAGEAADCCCAAAQVRVVLPPIPGAAARPELRLCAHHYRKAKAGLVRAGADVYDAKGHWLREHEQYWVDQSIARNPNTAQPI